LVKEKKLLKVVLRSKSIILGLEERILFEEKDWSRELEDIKTFDDPFNAAIKAE
jgi:hypothetical protein